MLACKNWNDKNRGDARLNPTSEELILSNPALSTKEGQPEPATPYVDSKGALNIAELGKYSMKEDWRRVTEHHTGTIRVDPATNTFVSSYERSYLSLGCNHCTDPACIKACPVKVFYKDAEFGLTLYDSTGCLSCGRCKLACPWEVPQFYGNIGKFAADDPNRPRMTKCTGCRDRIAENLKPACVAACRGRALDFGPIEELKAKYNNTYVNSLPEFNPDVTQPNIIFRKRSNSIKAY
jgi:anaerobic dimethyl sulfoxide reductase subunit B (iron-sulfur subunit)